jgi:hypothetical protein
MTVLGMSDAVLNVQITKTADGRSEYLQIMSPDMLSLNIVLVAGTINVNDLRTGRRRRAKKGET